MVPEQLSGSIISSLSRSYSLLTGSTQRNLKEKMICIDSHNNGNSQYKHSLLLSTYYVSGTVFVVLFNPQKNIGVDNIISICIDS